MNGSKTGLSDLKKDDERLLPGMVFGYYSGGGRRLEALFDAHQEKYYRSIINEGDPGLRPFFYCRPTYGSLALLANLAFQDAERREFLRRYLRIADFHSALFVLRRPQWAQSKPGSTARAQGDERFWYARGLVKDFLRDLWTESVAPIRFTEAVKDDYRAKAHREERLYLYIPDDSRLRKLAEKAGSQNTFFQWLESTEISDLVREVRIWVTREGTVDEIPFHEISDGERQLMTVLGLLKFAERQDALFLLDEPDTHLNPAWQLRYLQMIEEWGWPEQR